MAIGVRSLYGSSVYETFPGKLTLQDGSIVGAVLTIGEDLLTISAEGITVGTWPLKYCRVARETDELFRIAVDGEPTYFRPADALREFTVLAALEPYDQASINLKLAKAHLALDDTDIRDFTQRAWRERIGLVMQDIHLFPGTVGENLRALADDIPDENLDRAVDIVGARSLIESLPNGYDELLTEGGTNLSMGERQLLSFARAIVRDPDLLVLDEATSSIDPGTERRLQASIDRLLAGRTSLIIAHRLSTVRSADRILVIDQGRLLEEGTHDELIRLRGRYYHLYTNQFTRESQERILHEVAMGSAPGV